nr:hypothetical protein [Acidobacteriota bacterium]
MSQSKLAEPAALGQLSISDAATLSVEEVLQQLESTADGLAGEEAEKRLAEIGPNALRTHQANPWMVLGRQLRSPILILLIVTAA